MSHLAIEKSPADEAPSIRQLRRQVQTVLVPAKRALEHIKALVDANGKVVIETELGEHGSDLVETYTAIKLLVQTLDPEAVVPDLE